MSGDTRSVRPPSVSAKRRLKLMRTRGATLSFVPTDPLLVQVRCVLEAQILKRHRAERTVRIEAEHRQPRGVEDALPDHVHDDAEPRVDADVAAEGVGELIGKSPFCPVRISPPEMLLPFHW